MYGFCPLASGSKGNAIYIGTRKTKLLIDAGISFSRLKARLDEINVNIAEIDAVIVTHEHSDHIKGLDVLCKRHSIPVFANAETAKAITDVVDQNISFKIFSTGEDFEYKDVLIHPFSVQHDTLDPVGFTFEFDGMKLGICADLGFVSTSIQKKLQDCNYLYLESNHEPSMVYASSRPHVYKQRVLGRQGHLSNEECAKLIFELHHDKLQHVYLAHLSDECNHPDKALMITKELLSTKSSMPTVSIAYQEKVSDPIYF